MSRLDHGALIALIKVPTDVATPNDPARGGRPRADNNCFVRGNDSKTHIKPFDKFERRKELNGGTVVKGRCFIITDGSPQIRLGGMHASVIFESGESSSV